MKKTIRVLALTMAMTILGCTAVFAAETPAGIVKDHENGMQYLAQINAKNDAAQKALKEQTQKDYERGMAELRRAHSIHNDCGIEQQARAGFENGQKYLTWIEQQTKAAEQARDKEAQSGYNRGVAYLKQCGWQF